jgi:hypothetical protein
MVMLYVATDGGNGVTAKMIDRGDAGNSREEMQQAHDWVKEQHASSPQRISDGINRDVFPAHLQRGTQGRRYSSRGLGPIFRHSRESSDCPWGERKTVSMN